MSPIAPNQWQSLSPYLVKALEMSAEQRAVWLTSLRAERRDLAEALACGALAADARSDLRSNGRPASSRRLPEQRSRSPSPLDSNSLEFVDGDEAGSPGQLDRLDVREQPSQGREADSERLGCLATGVGDPLDAAAQRMPTALRNRFAHLFVAADVNAWCAWAVANDVAPEMIAFTTAIEPLRLANRMMGRDFYSWRLASMDGAPVVASNGVTVNAVSSLERERHNLATSSRPSMMSRDELLAIWDGGLILMTRRAGLTDLGRRFDITWFLGAISKYRRLLGEVLVASFFLQLFALVSPLFFQVVIDKVLVHRALSTLDVLVIGLLAISIFETVLGILRTYLFSHTTNRIDVELGARLFHHLLALPMAYFQARRVGDSVARVRELENIRNFLTSSALTLVIDLFFTFVFLAVMFYYSPLLTWIVAIAR